jgi:hypothetical protein
MSATSSRETSTGAGEERERRFGVVGVDVDLERRAVTHDEDRVAQPLERLREARGLEAGADHREVRAEPIRRAGVLGVGHPGRRVVRERRRRVAAQRRDHAREDDDDAVATRVHDAGLAEHRQQVGPAPQRGLAGRDRALERVGDEAVLQRRRGVGVEAQAREVGDLAREVRGHVAHDREHRPLRGRADRPVGALGRARHRRADEDRVDELARTRDQLLRRAAHELGEDDPAVAARAEQRRARDRVDDLVAAELVERAVRRGVPVELVQARPQRERHVVAGVAVGDREDVEFVDLLPAGLELRERALEHGSEANEAGIGHGGRDPRRSDGLGNLARLEAAGADVDRRGALPTRIRTFWSSGRSGRLVATIEWLRLLPNEGPFPQLWQTLAMSARQCSGRVLGVAPQGDVAGHGRQRQPPLRATGSCTTSPTAAWPLSGPPRTRCSRAPSRSRCSRPFLAADEARAAALPARGAGGRAPQRLPPYRDDLRPRRARRARVPRHEALPARERRRPPAHRRPVSRPAALRWLRQAADALDFAHRRGVVHRDVKPANLLLDEHGDLAVGDFGIAKVAADTALTQTGQVVGTAAYVSPEQADGRPVTPASDVFSLAVVAFELLAGARPGRPGAAPLPPAVRRVLGRGLARDPAERPRSAGAFFEELEDALEHDSIPAPGPQTAVTQRVEPVPRRAAPPSRGGRRRAPALLALAALALAGGRGGGDRAARRQRRRPARRRGADDHDDAADAAHAAREADPAAQTQAQTQTGAPAQTATRTTESAPAAAAPAPKPAKKAKAKGQPAPSAPSAVTAAPATLNDRGKALIDSGRPAEAIAPLAGAVQGYRASGQTTGLPYAYALYNSATRCASRAARPRRFRISRSACGSARTSGPSSSASSRSRAGRRTGLTIEPRRGGGSV